MRREDWLARTYGNRNVRWYATRRHQRGQLAHAASTAARPSGRPRAGHKLSLRCLLRNCGNDRFGQGLAISEASRVPADGQALGDQYLSLICEAGVGRQQTFAAAGRSQASCYKAWFTNSIRPMQTSGVGAPKVSILLRPGFSIPTPLSRNRRCATPHLRTI